MLDFKPVPDIVRFIVVLQNNLRKREAGYGLFFKNLQASPIGVSLLFDFFINPERFDSLDDEEAYHAVKNNVE